MAYYHAPLDRPLDWVTGAVFVASLVLFSVFVAFQLRSIVRSDEPRLRAIRALAVGLPLLLLAFASTYGVIAAQQPGAFTEPLDRTDGIYFTVTVFSTVGFGDIAPVSELARVLVTIQMVVGLVVVGLIARLVVGAVQLGLARRARAPEPSGEHRRSRTPAPPPSVPAASAALPHGFTQNE
ncbi:MULTISPECIES: potassium channel family protein [unclassified Geodermatophilus]